jgi:hypothetical protein
MPSIPILGFPPEFVPHCPKCRGTSSLHFNLTKHIYMWNAVEHQYSCRTCGSVGYGEEKLRSVFEPQLQDWLRAQRERAEEEARIAAEAAVAESRRSDAAEMARRARENEERVGAALERRREEARERKRRYDRERSARIRAAFREMREATQEPASMGEHMELPPPPVVKCAFHACSNTRSPTSKYCSKQCANRNSAWNVKVRGATGSRPTKGAE